MISDNAGFWDNKYISLAKNKLLPVHSHALQWSFLLKQVKVSL